MGVCGFGFSFGFSFYKQCLRSIVTITENRIMVNSVSVLVMRKFIQNLPITDSLKYA